MAQTPAKNLSTKYGLVRKEGKETIFWLRLIAELNIKKGENVNRLIGEGKRKF